MNQEMEALRQLISHYAENGWEKAWETNVIPWDRFGAVQPPLRRLLSTNDQDWPRQGRALVPGCGRGYDAIFITATLGLDTLAVDISSTAIKCANDLLASSPDLISGKVTFQEVDFFDLSPTRDQLFDLVYDYTFFVAIPPPRRIDWGHQMNNLVKSGGFLITLIFPINPPRDDGPPFFVRLDHYIKVLGPNWERVIEKVPDESLPYHAGFEYLVVWKKLGEIRYSG